MLLEGDRNGNPPFIEMLVSSGAWVGEDFRKKVIIFSTLGAGFGFDRRAQFQAEWDERHGKCCFKVAVQEVERQKKERKLSLAFSHPSD